MFKNLFQNWDRQIEKDFQKANRAVLLIKDDKIKKECEKYVENKKLIIKANKLQREEQVESIIRGIK